MNAVLLAFSLTLLAGLATGVGSALAFATKRTSPTFLALTLGFSAGVMIYVSFAELFPTALEHIAAAVDSNRSAQAITAGAFFAGIAVIAIIDRFVPEPSNPHEYHDAANFDGAPGQQVVYRGTESDAQLLRMGLFTAAALAIHNFPEGFATFLAGLEDPQLGIPIAIAIAIHNIPEGVAVAIPIFFATGSRSKAFWLSFASGLSEPLGGLIGWLILAPFLNDVVFGTTFAAIAGVMVYIALDELLPTAERYGRHHQVIYGVIGGMVVMAASLLLF